MTIPIERTNAVLNTEQFLLDLCQPSKTPRVPKTVREQARRLLRHYPRKYDLDSVVNGWDGVLQCPFGKVENV